MNRKAKRNFGAIGVLMLLGGCCAAEAQVAARDKLLRQLDDNLMNDIGPKYKKYLDADKVRPQELKDNDYGVVADSHKAIARVLSSSTAAVATPAKTGG